MSRVEDAIGREVVRACEEDPRLRYVADVLVSDRTTTQFAHAFTPVGLRNTFSVTKTVVTLLVGVAVDRGLCAPDDVVCHGDVTVADLLSMRRGARCAFDDIDRVRELPGGWEDAMHEATYDVEPGTEFRYDNCAFELLGYWLARRVGSSLEQLAARELFGPLGIESWHWPADPDGFSWASGEVLLEPESWAAVGRLLLGRGAGPDRRLVSEAWVDAMLTPTSTGGEPEHCAYGLGVWLPAPGRALLAGWAGQTVMIDDELGVVAVVTGDPARLTPSWIPTRGVVEQALAERGR